MAGKRGNTLVNNSKELNSADVNNTRAFLRENERQDMNYEVIIQKFGDF